MYRNRDRENESEAFRTRERERERLRGVEGWTRERVGGRMQEEETRES